ncbi:MAG TPA: putative toxin-antitoxin system toxin component, PIN family [Cyclobacteriaceae bacterium]|nr:putative toxin-antitoxin system toxin component, PIN family [Cyclobacteriaceae bacterium]
MAKEADRVIIDTNLWISFLITKNLKTIDARVKAGKIKVIFSLELMEEFLSTVHRSKFKKYFAKEDIEQLVDLFEVYGEMVRVISNVQLCRDPRTTFFCRWQKIQKPTF